MNKSETDTSFDNRMAGRLKTLRDDRGWSLDNLSAICGISRATLSRLEKAKVSPTATVLGRLCSAFGLTMSRLIASVESEFTSLIAQHDQTIWTDPETGFIRRSISPPAQTLAGEVLKCGIPPAQTIEYKMPPYPGLEHHLILLSGFLTLTVDGNTHDLRPGDCLRYQLFSGSTFRTSDHSGAEYILCIL
ncbi:MAG: helix-turn-helix transcriptional regulator [Alphaproteobacteria bacterium]|nr:helix-turn-helix transcriptional regulator [Alphaproteobacteria bacterium]